MRSSAFAKAMTTDERQGWIDRFQQVASQVELTDDLAALVKLLELPISCCLAVYEVLRQGNWARAEHPRAYVKKAAMTQARKMHLSIPLKDATLECGGPRLIFMDGYELDRRTTREGIDAVLEDEYREAGKAHPSRAKGKYRVAEQFDPDDGVREREQEGGSGLWPRECWTEQVLYSERADGTLRAGSLKRRDWKKLGEIAGLDAGESKALEDRSQGISRERAIELQPDEVSRKAIQSAWKRMTETGFPEVRAYLKQRWFEEERLRAMRVVRDDPDSRSRLPPEAPGQRCSGFSGNPLKAAWVRSGGTSKSDLGNFLIKYRSGPLRK